MKRATAKRITIKALRDLRGPFSQREAADNIGTNPETYQQWELGRAQPGPENFRRLLDHYTKWMKHYGQDPQPTIDKMLALVFSQADEDNNDRPEKKEDTP